jgi:protein-S-isoprenylcysteine O-methyltransferase Ste14
VIRHLARFRVTLGFVFGALCLGLARPTLLTLAVGGTLAVIGEGIRLWAAGHLEKNREVTASGPYRWTRHPLYVGSSLMGAGFAVAAARVDVAFLVALYLGVTLTAAILSEERFLAERFGEVHGRYREGQLGGAGRRFSWSRARRNREWRAVLGLVTVLVLLGWKAVQS